MEGPTYKLTIRTDCTDDLQLFINAQENDGILWELSHNFLGKFSHLDKSNDFMEGVEYILEKLREELKDYKTE